MADTLVRSSPSHDGLGMPVDDTSAFSSTLDPSTGLVLARTLPGDFSQPSSTTPLTYAACSTVDKDILCFSSPDVKHELMTRSPATLMAATGSPMPQTPQSHMSVNSPAPQQTLSELSVAVPPPPYPGDQTAFAMNATVAADQMSYAPGDQTPPSLLVNHSPSSQTDPSKPNMPPPPKKPLTPYMRFSKSIWQKVKATNQNSSVCEIGAAIGRLWREMNDIHKQQYNDDFTNDKARYDEELQNYLKQTGLHASDLIKAKIKKPRPPPGGRRNHSDSPDGKPEMSVDAMVRGYAESLNGGREITPAVPPQPAPTVTAYQGVSNGIMPGTTLPHFSQVWSGGGQDVYSADQLLAQMGDGTSAGHAMYAHADGTTLMSTDDPNQQVTALFGDQGNIMNHVPVASNGQDLLAPSSQSADQTAALNNWIWQQYTAVSGEQFVSVTDSLQTTAATDPSTGGLIIYQLNPDGTQTPFMQQPQLNSAAPIQPNDSLEPGEVRGPAGTTQQQSNGPSVDQSYHNLTAGYSALGGAGGTTAWINQDGTIGSADSEKQLLRGALVEKVREIQRLTRELEQAYALIHQLKQHNDFLQRQWMQVQPADGSAGS